MNNEKCDYKIDEELKKRFDLVKAKLFGFTHSYDETRAVYNLDKNHIKYDVLYLPDPLNIGDIVVLGSAWGKVRALSNDLGISMQKAGPSDPIEILGLNGVPEAGDKFTVVNSEARAREITEYRQRKTKNYATGLTNKLTLENMMGQIKDKSLKELPVLLKADMQGSIEAISSALNELGSDEVTVRIIHAAVGAVSETDIALASASNAILLAFNVRPNPNAKLQAQTDGVEIRQYSIIYLSLIHI